MQYIYCFVSAAQEDRLLPCGLRGKRVHGVSYGDIGAIVSEADPHGIEGNASNVLRHQQVVEQTMQLFRSVLPCRFGMWVADAAEVTNLLQNNASRLTTQLARLEAKVEITISAMLPGQQMKHSKPVAGATAGAQYLLTKRERYREGTCDSVSGQTLCQELNQSLSPFWTAVKTEERCSCTSCILRLSYLVEQEHLTSFQHAYEQVCQSVPYRKLLYTGPWPPYSFANVALFSNEGLQPGFGLD